MSTNHFGHLKLHIFYLAIIGILCCSWFYSSREDPRITRWESDTTTAFQRHISEEISTLAAGIRESAMDYPSSQSMYYARVADSLDQQQQRLLANWTKHPDRSPDEVWQLLHLTRDSLAAITSEDANVLRQLDTLLPDSAGCLLLREHLDPSGIAASCMSRLLLSYDVVMRYLSSKVAGTNTDCGRSYPVIVAENWAPKAGELFSADVFMAEYHVRPSTFQEISVNNEALEVKDGVALYQQHFQTPGLRKLHVKIKEKNTFTGLEGELEKSFFVRVLEK